MPATPDSTSVTLVDVAPRDGLQSDGEVVSTDAKVELISRIAAAGIRRIEATSFVNPKRVPQMADADAVMAELLALRAAEGGDGPLSRTSLIGLVLNERGLDRALTAGVDEINAVVVVSDTFAGKNQGTDTEGTILAWEKIASVCRDAGVPTSVTLAASFGCPYEAEVPVHRLAEVVRRCAAAGGDELALADSIGVASPVDVRERVRIAADVIATAGAGQELRVHFHNTRNTGLANVVAAVEAGVHVVDGSLGGIGGCPFAPNATGNVPTEDVAYLLDRMGYDLGVDLDALIDTVQWMQSDALLGRRTPGLLAHAGAWPPAG